MPLFLSVYYKIFSQNISRLQKTNGLEPCYGRFHSSEAMADNIHSQTLFYEFKNISFNTLSNI